MEKAEEQEPKPQAKVSVARPLQPMSAINRVVSVLYNYKRSVLYKDIAAACNMHPVNVSQALSAARDLGLTELVGKKGLYNLTDPGKEYARFLTSGKENEAKSFLQGLLRANPLWVEIITFLNATRGQSRNPLDLVLEIERKAGKQWKPAMRTKLRDSLVSILEYAEMIVREGANIVPVGKDQVPQEEVVEVPAKVSVVSSEEEFARLVGDEFTFEVRRDLEAIEFAESQFTAWVNYLKKKLLKEKEEARQSGGVPNQEQ